MSIRLKKIFLVCGLLFFSQFLTGNSDVWDLEILCPEIKLVLCIDDMVTGIHHCIQETMWDKENEINAIEEHKANIKEQIEDLDAWVTELETEIHLPGSSTICLTRENAEAFIKSARLYIIWSTYLNKVRRRGVEEEAGGFRLSRYRGYSLAYAAYQQSKAILLLQCRNLKNFLVNNELLRGINGKVDDIDKKVNKLLKRNQFALTLNQFSGKENAPSFRSVGLSYRWQINKHGFLIIPELSVEFGGNHHAVSSLSLAYEISDKIQFFTGGDVAFPKTGSTNTGWHIGITILSLRPLVVGVKYSSLFSIGIHLAVLL